MRHRIVMLIILTMVTGLARAAEPARFLAATPESVLFIGNSFTGGTYNIYAHMRNLALAADDPDTIFTSAYLNGGKDLKYHWGLGVVQDKIRNGAWDAVVLQEFNPLVPGSAGLDTFFHYAGLYDALIDSIGAQTVFYMTHDNQLHDIANIQAANDSAGIRFNAVVVPCGLAHELVKAEHPYLNPLVDPYDTDHVHPGQVGRYLNISTFYTACTRKSPMGINYDAGIIYSAADVLYMQSAAWDLMRDYIDGPCTDTVSAPTVPGSLTGQPRSLSSVSLTWNEASHTACGVRKYNVYREGTYAGSAYQPVFVDTSLLGGTAYEYTVTALSLGGVESAVSSPVTVTTIADTILPELVNVPLTKRATQVELIFSEELDSASAETPGNYTIDNGITVSATVRKGGTRVSLTVSALSEGVTYTLSVTGVKDASTSQNVIAAGTQKTFEYIAPAMMTGCIGYYPFELNLEDYSTSGLTAHWKRESSFTDQGYDRYGVELIGTDENSYPIIPRADVNRNLTAFTVALWMKKAVANEDGWLFYQHTGFDLRVQASTLLGGVVTDGAGATFTYNTSLVNDTEWHHVAMTWDGSMIRVFVDAVQVGSTAASGTKTAYAGINIGNHAYAAGSARSFFGTIDEFRMYNAALDSSEVAALFSNDASAVAAADSAAVQEIIQQNMLITSVSVISDIDPVSGRVVGLHVDSMGTYLITREVGQLTALRALYVSGDASADSQLTIVDGAIGNCTALETLILKDNILASLPDEITNLTSLKLLDVSGNLLCNITDPVKTWLDTYDPDWADSQGGCTTVISELPEVPVQLRLQAGMLLDARGRMVARKNAATGVYLGYSAETGQLSRILIIR